LTPDDLAKLPAGAKYQAKDANATGSVEKKPDGTLEFTANCDSLTFLVTDLRTEIYHLNRQNDIFKQRLNTQKTIEVNRLNSWQSFQIWCGRIALGLLALFITYKQIKPKIKWLKN
jgi:hypothetical protein